MHQEGSNLAALIRSAFRRHGFHELESIGCTVDSDVVTLTGQVAGGNLRRAAGTIARSVYGVRAVRNRIRVEGSDSLLRALPNSLGQLRADQGKT